MTIWIAIIIACAIISAIAGVMQKKLDIKKEVEKLKNK